MASDRERIGAFLVVPPPPPPTDRRYKALVRMLRIALEELERVAAGAPTAAGDALTRMAKELPE